MDALRGTLKGLVRGTVVSRRRDDLRPGFRWRLVDVIAGSSRPTNPASSSFACSTRGWTIAATSSQTTFPAKRPEKRRSVKPSTAWSRPVPRPLIRLAIQRCRPDSEQRGEDFRTILRGKSKNGLRAPSWSSAKFDRSASRTCCSSGRAGSDVGLSRWHSHWQTRSIFDRYDIVSSGDLREASAKSQTSFHACVS
jgi:hypothetical protein